MYCCIMVRLMCMLAALCHYFFACLPNSHGPETAGEVYSGLPVGQNDGEEILQQLSVSRSIPELLSGITGPWSLCYYQTTHNTLYFGKDAAGALGLQPLGSCNVAAHALCHALPCHLQPACTDSQVGNDRAQEPALPCTHSRMSQSTHSICSRRMQCDRVGDQRRLRQQRQHSQRPTDFSW